VECVLVVGLEIRLDGKELVVHGWAHALPATEHFERHEVLAQDSGDEDAVLFGDDLFRDATFFLDEKGCVAI
jgi:hypothetical protein